MNVQAQKFLQKTAYLLAGKVSDDKHITHLFQEVVSTLPNDHSKLKAYLLDNSTSLTTVFIKYLKEEKNAQKNTSLKCNSSTKQSSIVQQVLLHKEDSNQIMEIINNAFSICSDPSSKMNLSNRLLVLATTLKSPTVTTCLVNGLYNSFESELSSLNTKAESIIQELQTFLLNALVIFQTQTVVLDKKNDSLPSLRDALTALFSLYIDVTLLKSQSNRNQNEVVLKTSNKLLETGRVILDDDLYRLLESIIQLSYSKLPDSDTILKPLYEYTLLQSSWLNKPMSVLQYLQFMLAVRQGLSLFDSSSKPLSERLKRFGLQVKAPEEFHKWVSKCKTGDDLLDMTPLLPNTTSLSITKFFINECELDTLEDFLDLHFTDRTNDSMNEDSKETHEDGAVPEETFFFDKTSAAVDDVISSDNDNIVSPNDESPRMKEYEDSSGDDDDDDDNLLKETEYLLDSELLTPKDSQEEPVKEESLPIVLEEQNKHSPEKTTLQQQQSTVSDDDSHTHDISKQSQPEVVESPKRTNTRKRASPSPSIQKSARKTRKPGACVVLSPIDERTVHNSKVTKNCATKTVVVRKSERSDSESSTGSHGTGYMTRSRSRLSSS